MGTTARPEVARGRRAGADLGGRSGASDRRRAGRVVRPRRGGDVRRAVRHPGARPSSCSSAGSRAARSSGAAAADQRGRGRIFYFRPGHETHPTYFHRPVRQVIANAGRWAAGRAGRRSPSQNQAPQEPPTGALIAAARRCGDHLVGRCAISRRSTIRSPETRPMDERPRTGLPSRSVRYWHGSHSRRVPRTRRRRSGTAARRGR